MHTGKLVRLARLQHKHSGRFLIVPMDHGFTVGPIPGLIDLKTTIKSLGADSGLVQAVVLHRGVIEHITQMMPACKLPPCMLHVSASTAIRQNSNIKIIVAGIEEALMLGVDGVSIHINLGDDVEPQMLRDFGSLASECQRWGMPLLAMMYVHRQGKNSTDVADIKLAARMAAEMGADLVKVSYPGSVDKMQDVVNGCFVPVLIAGGEKLSSVKEVVQFTRDAIAGGAAGLCMGRNLFQSADISAVLHEVAEGVHGRFYETPTLLAA